MTVQPGKVRVGILGGSGYTGRELLRLLARHPHATITVVTSRQYVGKAIAELHPSLRGLYDLSFQANDVAAVVDGCDLVFSALPHSQSMTVVGKLLDAGLRVIDLSADYRLKDPNLYAEWYALSHQDTGHLEEAVYGLPELFSDAISRARLVANPGCYATAAILGLAPLVSGRLIELDDVVIDAKSGVSGAGRSPRPAFHFPDCVENMWAYHPGTHRHTPEIQEVLSYVAGEPVRVFFTPHVVAIERGIHATIYARLRTHESTDDLYELFATFYAQAPFVRLTRDLPQVKSTTGTNFCDIGIRRVGDRVVVCSVLDNLLKGASGTAVQNFNLMLGIDQTTALW